MKQKERICWKKKLERLEAERERNWKARGKTEGHLESKR